MRAQKLRRRKRESDSRRVSNRDGNTDERMGHGGADLYGEGNLGG